MRMRDLSRKGLICMGYKCDNQDGAEAAITITILELGDVLAFCGPCAPVMLQSLVNNMTGDMDAPIGQVPTDPTSGDESDDDEHADADAIEVDELTTGRTEAERIQSAAYTTHKMPLAEFSGQPQTA